eukprot:CAMPEP_0173208936 /NCGR_PEP_ID=MMETSP1141-20130122/22811_1 /TAXON_ID=483371 /ORGANISM="non described non described, Strain CCMP2298" /LENGTH=109 /DNA_ID=CAMNT_0014135479 /DNA_START=1 /DNA_END=327 /DNA_ORIENTATION=+
MVFSKVRVETEAYGVETITGGGSETDVVGDEIDGAVGVVVGASTSTTPTSVLSRSCVDFVVAMGLCGGEARRMACLETLRQFKLVPMGAVAACTGCSHYSRGVQGVLEV